MKIAQICALLQAQGYSTHLDPKVLYNSIYTALKRKTDIFLESSDGKWKLVEWANKSTDK